MDVGLYTAHEVEKSIIGDQVWAELTDGQKIDAVVAGRATLKQMSEGLLDGSEQLRAACGEYLAHTTTSFENLPAETHDDKFKVAAPSQDPATVDFPTLEIARSKLREAHEELMQRLGQPSAPDPQLQRYGRTVLIERNIYRLPNGQEFLPCRPSGTLAASRHLYALVSCEQFLKGKQGSVYVRKDGRIFDYSVDSKIPLGEIFETGYTIADLERTGHYAPERKKRRRKSKPANLKRAAAVG
ncbi:MAG TPA: hypothetical protein VLL54_01310 [Pyrinomonadaceae bacterium]|nr:hypothetical protein [Pyrinomonadaceae bacterium]